MNLANPITHQQQPTPCSCTATCVAMAVGIRVEDLGVPLSNALDLDDFGVWLAERGIWMRQAVSINSHGEMLRQGRVYLLGMRSQNVMCSDHTVLADCRGEPTNSNPRSGWKFFDPVAWIDGRKAYTWVDEGQIIDFCELRDRAATGVVCVGLAPGTTGNAPGATSRFVLDADGDSHAVRALLAYAESCSQEFPLLARDLRAKAQLNCEHDWTETLHGPDTVGEHCHICGVDRDYDYGDEYG